MAKTNYESVVILTPVLSERMLQDAASSFEKLITENGGELIHKENWGLTKMAYPIQRKTTGFYQIFEFAADADADRLARSGYFGHRYAAGYRGYSINPRPAGAG